MARNEKLRIVLDTNVILNAMSPKLPYRHLLRRAVQGEFEWCVTTEILFEYEEKIIEFFSAETANALLEALLMSSHVKKVKKLKYSIGSIFYLIWTTINFWTALLPQMLISLFQTTAFSRIWQTLAFPKSISSN